MKGANYNMDVGNYILLDSSKRKNNILNLNVIIFLEKSTTRVHCITNYSVILFKDHV